jgi:hypothetical protein
MSTIDRVDVFRRLQALPPECPHDAKVGHRLKQAGRPDRFETVLPTLLAKYSAIRLHEYDETHARSV